VSSSRNRSILCSWSMLGLEDGSRERKEDEEQLMLDEEE
jgi:hypothetical protein